MRQLLFSLAVLAMPVQTMAQSAPSTATPGPKAPDATAPSNMGRWDEYRQRQERSSRQKELHDSRMGSRSANLSNSERRLLGGAYAQCVVEKEAALVRDYVLLNAIERKKDERYRKLADRNCLPNNSDREISRLYLSGHGALYVFAEQLLKTERLPVVESFSEISMLAHPKPMKMEDYNSSGKLSKQEFAKKVDQSFGEVVLSRIGECVVRADTGNARNLLSTAVGSEDEIVAIQTLMPALSGCIQDGSMKMNPEQVRGTVALNLYRLTTASMQTEKKSDA